MRKPLPNRRHCETLEFEHEGFRFLASVARFPDGSVAELFVNTAMRAGSEADTSAKDAAIAISLALQHGCPFEVLRSAMSRKSDGRPSGPLGAALDAVGRHE